MNGYIKLYRKLINWEWYTDINTKTLFIHCLLMANHQTVKYRGTLITRGSFVTSRDILSQQTNLSVQSIRTSLKRLKSTNDITINSTKQGTLITIVNYDTYQAYDVKTNQQSNQETNFEVTNDQPTSNQQVTSNKNDKNDKNDKKILSRETKRNVFTPPSVEEVQEYCDSRNNGISGEEFVAFYESKGWMVGKNKMVSWKGAVSTWETKRKKENQNQIVTPSYMTTPKNKEIKDDEKRVALLKKLKG